MAEPEVALVFSAESWVEALHRYCSDHGGARVRQLLVDPVLALDEEYSTLVSGHRWPALTPALVDELHLHGRTVLGVWDRAEPDSRALLIAVGVDGLVASDASPREIVDAITTLPRAPESRSASMDDFVEERGAPRVVVGGPAGSGSTEIAIGLTHALRGIGRRPVLVDLDDVAPSIAPRLGLPIEPNLCTAVDAVEYRSGELRDAVVRVGELDVVAGVPAPSGWAHLRPPEVLRVVRALAREFDPVVLDVAVVGERAANGLARAAISDADVLVGVASPTPVGVARFIAWLADVLPSAADAELHLVVNRAPSSAFRRGEIRNEILGCVAPAAIAFVPADRRVEDAAWSGALVGRGAFARAVREVATALIAPATPTAKVSGRRS
jgi:MinD-like ATPase involved in chromosome partitioning or flagellar assembly